MASRASRGRICVVRVLGELDMVELLRNVLAVHDQALGASLAHPPAGGLRPAKAIVNGRRTFGSDLTQFTGTAPEPWGDKDQGRIKSYGMCPLVQTVPIPPLATGIDLAPQERCMSKMKLLLATALSVALIDVPTHAAPTVPSISQVRSVTLAQWHRGGGGWRRGGWGWGPWPWIGLGVVAGAIIGDQAYRPHPGHYYDEGPYDGPTIILLTTVATRAKFVCRTSAPSSGAPATTRPIRERGACAHI